MLQPENVLVMCDDRGEGHLRLADFGISYSLKAGESFYSCEPAGLLNMFCFCLFV